MTCQNCTQTVPSAGDSHMASISEENCWIVIVVSFMFILGLIKLTKIVLKIMSPLSWLPNDLHKKYVPEGVKSWALITGGSQGIGLAFAEQLAKMNFNIILMSRSESKLKQAQQTILKQNPKVEVKYFSVDFEKLRTPEQYEEILEKIKQYDISVLVNNVGVYNPTRYLDSTYELIRRQAVVNLLPITCMTRLILPRMIERNKKSNKKSASINISSGAALSALEYASNYCATKAFDDLLTSSLAVEYRREPVDFLSVRPYLVTSAMTRGQTSILHVTPNQCVKGALNDLGRYEVSFGHFWHRVQGVFIDELNGKIVNFITSKINKNLALKYKEIDQKKK